MPHCAAAAGLYFEHPPTPLCASNHPCFTSAQASFLPVFVGECGARASAQGKAPVEGGVAIGVYS